MHTSIIVGTEEDVGARVRGIVLGHALACEELAVEIWQHTASNFESKVGERVFNHALCSHKCLVFFNV